MDMEFPHSDKFMEYYEEALKAGLKLFAERSGEGRNHFVPAIGMMIFGRKSAATLLWQKVSRLVGDIETGNFDKALEEAEDLVNYSALYIATDRSQRDAEDIEAKRQLIAEEMNNTNASAFAGALGNIAKAAENFSKMPHMTPVPKQVYMGLVTDNIGSPVTGVRIAKGEPIAVDNKGNIVGIDRATGKFENYIVQGTFGVNPFEKQETSDASDTDSSESASESGDDDGTDALIARALAEDPRIRKLLRKLAKRLVKVSNPG